MRTSQRPLGAKLSFNPAQKQIRVTRRLDLPCESVGFARPPCRLDLMFIKGSGKWTLIVRCASGRMPEVERWLGRYGPAEVSVGKGSAPTVLRADFTEGLAGWTEILQTVKVRCLQLAPTGLASLFYEDDDVGIPLLLHVMHRGAVDVHDRPSLGGQDGSQLTMSQYEVLSLAVGLGYYEAAPRANQQEIAVHLGITPAQVSDLLVRGEANVITSHIDSFMMTRMCDASFGLGPDAGVERPNHEVGIVRGHGKVGQTG